MRRLSGLLLPLALCGAAPPHHIYGPRENIPEWGRSAIMAVLAKMKDIDGTRFADLSRNGSVVCGTFLPKGFPSHRFAFLQAEPVTMASQFDSNPPDTLLIDDDPRVSAAITRVCP